MFDERLVPLLKRINNKVNSKEWEHRYWEDSQRALLEEWHLGDFPTYELTTADIINARQ